MATKYIVDNVPGQTINGDITINGNLSVTGVTTGSLVTYKALLTQTGSQTGTTLNNFNDGLIIGETYTITYYTPPKSGDPIDDFSNIANVQSGVINETGCVFIATGETPTNWSNGSELTSNGGLIVDVLENTLGYDLSWSKTPFGGDGYYIAVNDTTGPIYNSFQRNKIEIITPFKTPFNNRLEFPPFIVPSIISFNSKDNIIQIDVIDVTGGPGVLSDDLLYYTPIEIKIKQGPLTPVVAYGLNVSEFPYGNISIDVFAGETNVETFYGDYNEVRNIDELVIALNNDTTINYLGTFSVNGGVEGGIILTTTERIKNQFSPNNTLTFESYND
jgi:hypothetical protein